MTTLPITGGFPLFGEWLFRHADEPYVSALCDFATKERPDLPATAGLDEWKAWVEEAPVSVQKAWLYVCERYLQELADWCKSERFPVWETNLR